MSFELLDDQLASAVLEDALAFIDAYEHPASPAAANINTMAITLTPAPAISFGPVALPSCAVDIPRTKTSLTKKQSKNGQSPDLNGTLRSRNRPRGSDTKLELERLRHDVKLLEARLAHVKSESLQSYGSPSSTSSTSNSSSEEETLDTRHNSQRALVAAWKSVALRQFQRRSQSEMTNRKLKQVLAKQLKLAKSLEALYSKRPSQSDLELVHRAPELHCDKSPLDSEDSLSPLILSHVQQLGREIDIHLMNAGLAGSESRILSTLSKPDLFLGTVHETTSSAPLPLNIESADRLLWGGMRMFLKSKSGGPPKCVSILDDGVDKSFVASVKSAQYSFNLMTRSVTRKFMTKDRIVYAWTSISTVVNKNVRYLGEGLIVLERSPSAPQNSTLLKNWHRLHAEQVGSQLIPSAATASELERFKVTGMSTLSQNTSAYFNLLENVLLEAATTSNSMSEPVPLCMTSVVVQDKLQAMGNESLQLNWTLSRGWHPMHNSFTIATIQLQNGDDAIDKPLTPMSIPPRN